MKFYIYINGNSIGEVSGYEAAWDAYRKAIALCALTDARCDLVDGETGEAIDTFDYEIYEDELDEDYEPDYFECGFDPYEGCYTYDC